MCVRCLSRVLHHIYRVGLFHLCLLFVSLCVAVSLCFSVSLSRCWYHNSAALDQSLYEGHRASMESGMLELADGDEDVIPEGGEGLKPVAVTTTAATAGIRTSGAPAVSFIFYLPRQPWRAFRCRWDV